MNKKIILTSFVTAIAIASIVLMLGLTQTQTITAQTQKQGNGAYIFAEGVNTKATFMFREATVTYDFQIFTQNNNLFGTSSGGVSTRTSIPEFTLQRVVGDTPYLHKAVDQTWYNNGRVATHEYSYRSFDMKVDFVSEDHTYRTLKYTDCGISNYKVITEFDKMKGHTKNEGFAVLEQYTFQCAGFKPESPTYDAIKSNGDKYVPYGRQ